MKQILGLSLTALLMLISACSVNPYMQFYQGLSPDQVIANKRFIVSTNTPQLFTGTNPETDAENLMADNYCMIGMSGFEAAEIADNQASIHGRSIHAAVVLLYKQYTNTLSGTVPLTLPNSTTTTSSGNIGGTYGSWTTTTHGSKTYDIPYSVNRYSYYATYWVKGNPPIFGAYFNDLNDDQKQSIGSNKGIVLNVLMKNSPAYYSDFLKGDILKKINQEEIYDRSSFSVLLEKYAGTEVSVEVYREGRIITKSIKLNVNTP